MARKLENSVRTIEKIVHDLAIKVEEQDKAIAKEVRQVTIDYLEKYKVQGNSPHTNNNAAGGANL